MKTKQRKQVLRELSRAMNDKESVLKKYSRISTGLLFVPAVILGLIADEEIVPMGIGAFLGFIMGVSVLYKVSALQLPVFVEYLNKDKIEADLEELN